jgi:hypothetical protein
MAAGVIAVGEINAAGKKHHSTAVKRRRKRHQKVDKNNSSSSSSSKYLLLSLACITNSEEVNFPVFSFVQLLSSKMKAFAVRFSKLIRFSPTYLL